MGMGKSGGEFMGWEENSVSIDRTRLRVVGIVDFIPFRLSTSIANPGHHVEITA
jgi:hypothetical protein